MKIDLHVHSKASRRPSEWLLKKIGCSESYTEPIHLYNIAKERGMTHVTITDHNCIDSVLSIVHLPGVFMSEEITTYFPEDNCKIHVLAYNISEKQHKNIQHLRKNIMDLVPYLYSEDIFHVLAHPLYAINDRLTADHFEKLLLLFNNFEMNGARNHRENLQLKSILNSLALEKIEFLSSKHKISTFGKNPHNKTIYGGSDDHSSLNIARTYTEIKKATLANFTQSGMAKILPKIKVRPALPETMAHNIYSIAWQFYRSKLSLEPYAGKDPLVHFLDRSLLSVTTDDPKILSKLYFFFRRRHKRKGDKPLSASLPGLLKYETNLLIQENPDLFNGQSLNEISPAEREQQWFDFVNRLSSRLTVHFSDHILSHLSGADVLNIFQTIGSAGGLYTLLSPYFITYTQFTKGRELGKELRDRLQKSANGSFEEREQVNIAHFTDTFYEINGVALTLRQQVKLASKKKKKYTLITCDASDQEPQDGIKRFEPIGTYELPEYPELQIYYPPFLDMLKYCHDKGFTEIHAATPGPIGLAGLAIAKILRLPVSGTYHTELPQYVKVLTGSDFIEEMAWKFTLWFYDQLNIIYAPSESTAKELVNKGISANKIRLYPRGIDIKQFHPAKKNGFFNKYLKEAQVLKFLYVGRISKEKNLEILVKAFRKLAEKHKNVFLCIVGDGPYMDGMKSEMQGLPCLFTGYLKGESLSAAYASSDIFVFPSTTDTFGNVVLEAQASGLPVIVTDQGGPSENMIPGKTGLIVKSPCEKNLFAAMEALANDPVLVRNMGKQARFYTESRSFEKAFMETWEMFGEIKMQKTAMPWPFD